MHYLYQCIILLEYTIMKPQNPSKKEAKTARNPSSNATIITLADMPIHAQLALLNQMPKSQAQDYYTSMQKRAEQNDIQGLKLIAASHFEGVKNLDIPLGLEQSFSFYERLRKLKDSDALMNMASIRFNQKRLEEAAKLYKEAALENYVPAMFHYAYCYFRLFFQSLKSSTIAYDPQEMLFASRMLRKSLKIAPDQVESFFKDNRDHTDQLMTFIPALIHIADLSRAENSKIMALDLYSLIGIMAGKYPPLALSCKNVKEKQKELATEIWKAAKQKDPQAQYEVGFCLEHGIGYQEDKAKSKQYYEKAAMQGHLKAKEKIQSLNPTVFNFENFNQQCDNAEIMERLALAASNGDIQELQIMLPELRGSINQVYTTTIPSQVLQFMTTPKPGPTLLHLACQSQHVQCAEFLIGNEADVENQDDNKMVPLGYLKKNEDRKKLYQLSNSVMLDSCREHKIKSALFPYFKSLLIQDKIKSKKSNITDIFKAISEYAQESSILKVKRT